MLNFSVDVNLNIDRIQYPVLFDKKNICLHCATEGSLVFVDKFGKETSKEIFPFDHLKCKKCGRRFSILWQSDPDTKKMYPSAVEYNIKQEFVNLIGNKKLKGNAEKSFE